MHVVTADLDLCQGYGNCVVNAPDVFDLDESGTVAVLRHEVSDAEVDQVEAAVAACPVSALSLGEA